MTLLAPLLAEPTQFTLLAALRLVEESAASGSRLGEGSVLADDPVRVEQLPSMGLQGSDVAGAEMRGGTLWLTQYAFGNLAPHGALPTHLLQLVHSRTGQLHDRTLTDFINWFQHRFAELFYRAYADGVPTAPGGQILRDRFRQYFAALTGVPIQAGGVGRLPAEGLLGRGASLGPAPRSAEALEHLVGEYFGVPAEVESFCGEWLEISPQERLHLGRGGAARMLGGGATLGTRTFQCQHRFIVSLGPLAAGRWRTFMPDAPAGAALFDLVRRFAGIEWSFAIRLKVEKTEAPRLSTIRGAGARLGWESWLGAKPQSAEILLQGSGVAR